MSGPDSDAERVALVLGGSAPVTAVLEQAGLRCHSLDSAAEFDPGSGPTALVVLCAPGTLAEAISSTLPDLRQLLPETPVVIVCAEVRPGETRLALAAGVVGVVIEANVAAALGACVHAALAGQVCVPRRQARQVEAATLSAREKQILGMVVMGYMNSEIAEQLFVAESTVKSHLSSAFGKLDVRSRNEAVDLILDAERGLGIGILGLATEPVMS